MKATGSLVLFSGGMDSTIALFDRLVAAKAEGGRVYALTFLYGQRHRNETVAARRVWSALQEDERYSDVLGKRKVVLLDMPRIGSLTGNEPVTTYDNLQAAKEFGDLDNAFVPYRNLIMLAAAAPWAYRYKVNTISTGLRGGFPDCTAEFERAVQACMNMAVPDFPITISTPTHESRVDCLKLAATLPGCMEALGMTLTCFNGQEPPCGHCLPCLKRAEGFALAGLPDPLIQRTGQN